MLVFCRILFGLILLSTCMIGRAEIATGTGFFVSPNGYFVTNWHVVENANTILVLDHLRVRHIAQVVMADPANDLAILRIDGKVPAWLPIVESSSSIRRGTEVLTVGYPRLSLQGSEPKVTNGIVNSLSGVNDDPRHFQISVPVQPGNSGGALVTNDGLVIGVVSAKLSAEATLKFSGSLPENVNYAVKSNYLLELLRSHKVQAKIETRQSGKDLKLIQLAERVERATGLIVAADSANQRSAPSQRNSDATEREIERYCQHERTYMGPAVFEKCASGVIARMNRAQR